MQLPAMTVYGDKLSVSTSPTLEQAREELARVPGGTTLIEAEQFRDGFTGNLQEVLSLSPGVYIQSRFGGSETRTSIRGSGISQTFNIRGIRFLMNGLPFSEADGNVRPQLVEPLAMRYVEVYRGANALPYGAAYLGGAINFVAPTGYTAPPLLAHIEYGSFDYVRPQLSAAGLLTDRTDGYLSLSGIFQDGFRPQSEEETYRLYGNLGHRFTDNSETRLHVSIQDNNLQLPGGLSKDELERDPTQANEFWRMRGSARDFNLYRVDLQHAIALGGEDRLDVGAYYQRLEMFHPLPFTLFGDGDQNDTGFSLRHSLKGKFGGNDTRLFWGANFAWGDNDSEEFESVGTQGEPVRGARTKVDKSEAFTAEVFAEDQLVLDDRWTLVGGVQLAYANRENDAVFGSGVTADEDYFGVNPKLGFIFRVDEAVQLFGNVSRSFEPPTILEFANTTAGSLDAQEATTIEIGTRGSSPLLKWEVAFYHSWVEDEILQVETPVGSGEFETNNASETTLHTGVELGVDGKLPLHLVFGGSDGSGALHFLGTYTYNRLVFDDEPLLGDSDIPGIPTQFGRAELLYEHPSGFFIGPTLEASDSWFVDFANTLEADSYWLFGAKAGFKTKRISVFVEGRNLTDEAYASNTDIIDDARKSFFGPPRIFNPGMPAAVFGGIEIRF
ncbi:MAG: TonB-dependent receptor family protein [Gammaproteobacteria bacterium]